MAVSPASDPAGNDRVVTRSVTNDFSPGFPGAVERFRSLVTGLGITSGNALTPVHTTRYPFEKLTVSPRWRGSLRLRGVLGTDDVSDISCAPPEYNGLIDRLNTEKRLPPCVGNCPANVDARGQSYHAAEGRVAEAYELVRERNIMPGVLGRICHHPCETACRRNQYDEPIAIRPLHRHLQEAYWPLRAERVKKLPVTREQTVCIVGSGPSGLAAAHDLMRLGYAVTMYEKADKPGGALYSGVPSYRLPREVLHGEIDDLLAMGLKLTCNVEIGPDVPMDHLIGEFDAVLIAAGLQTSRIIPIPGNEADGVRGALEFLADGNWKHDADVKGKRVFVIGGGNVAVDVARVALRVGASEVRLGCLESDAEMPCHPWEIEEALDEGVIAMCSQGPEAVLEEDGKVVGMRLRACVQVFDEMGRFAPKYGDAVTDVPCDVVVFSIGQASKLGPLVAGTDLLLDERGNLMVDGQRGTTTVPGVFASGEVVTGPGSAIASIATGHEAATSIHRYLTGQDILKDRIARPVPLYDHYAPARLEGIEESRRRAVMAMSDPELRVTDFRQVELGLTSLEAAEEATRCLRCQSGVCVGCTFCARTCPDYCIQVERVDDPGSRCLTRYELDLSKCCFCGLCAEQCPTDALTHTGEYELSFYHRDLMVMDKGEMRRESGGTRTTGADGRAPSDCSRDDRAGEDLMTSQIVLAVLLGFALAGALLVVFAREVLRLALGLGVLLLVVAGIFLFYEAPFLAVAQVFVYAGGVLVLLLFALMLLKRDASGGLVLKQNHDVSAAVVAIAVFVLIGVGYGSLGPTGPPKGAPVERMAFALLGPYLPHFEALALLLLVALVGAIAIVAPKRASAADDVTATTETSIEPPADADEPQGGEPA